MRDWGCLQNRDHPCWPGSSARLGAARQVDGEGQRVPPFCKDVLEAYPDSACAESEPVPRETPDVENEAGFVPLADVLLARTVVTPWPLGPSVGDV